MISRLGDKNILDRDRERPLLLDFCKGTFKFSLPVVAWGVVWVSLGLRWCTECPFGSPVFIPCESVPLSVFLWTCHLQPSRPTLPPSHSSPNSDLMPTSCWPLTHIFYLFLRLVVHFVYFCALEIPTFLSVRSVTNTPHTDCVLSTHWEGGGDPRSLSLSFAVSVCDHHPILNPSSSLAALLFSFSHSIVSLFSHPFFPCPPACLHVHEADFHRSSPPVFAWRHWDEGQK